MSMAAMVFSDMIDDEIACAMRAGVPLELIYAALMERAREVGNAIIQKHQDQEDRKCAA